MAPGASPCCSGSPQSEVCPLLVILPAHQAMACPTAAAQRPQRARSLKCIQRSAVSNTGLCIGRWVLRRRPRKRVPACGGCKRRGLRPHGPLYCRPHHELPHPDQVCLSTFHRVLSRIIVKVHPATWLRRLDRWALPPVPPSLSSDLSANHSQWRNLPMR